MGSGLTKNFGFQHRNETVVVAGKFMPFHSGHKALLDFAAKQGVRLYVLLVADDEFDTVDPHVRALSIYESFEFSNNVKVHIVDNIYTDDTDIAPGTISKSNMLWARYTREILGFVPDAVVASEEYAEGWANAMGCKFIMFDLPRRAVPVSGTLCRDNIYAQKDMLPPATRRYMNPRVVVLGAESTGTTTLATALGNHYKTFVVPELGHTLGFEALANGESVEDDSWDDARFWLVSRGQDAAEERYARNSNGVLICDTDSWATAQWYEYYMEKKVPGFTWQTYERLRTAGLKQRKKHALYILTSPEGVEFEDDGTRTGADLRQWHHGLFAHELEFARDNIDDIPFIEVKGTEQERLEQSIEAINKILQIPLDSTITPRLD